MKSPLIIFALFAFFIGLNIESIESLGEDSLLGLLEEIRKRMCHPIPKFGLPALDPLEIQHAEIELDNDYLIDFKGSITDFRLIGLSDFVVDDLKISTNPLKRSNVNVTLPMTAFESLYTAKGSLGYLLNLGDGGNAAASLNTFRFSVSWRLKAGLSLAIRNLQITITIGGIDIYFENLFEEERLTKFFLDLVNELGLELLNDVWEDYNGLVQFLAEEKINEYIAQYTLADIIKLIEGGDGPIFDDNDPPGDCKDEKLAKMFAYEVQEGS